MIAMIAISLLFFVLGVFFLTKPEIVWELQHLLTVKDGEPTEFAILMLRIGGAAYLVIAAAVVIAALMGIR